MLMNKKFGIIAVMLLVAGAIAVAGYYFMERETMPATGVGDPYGLSPRQLTDKEIKNRFEELNKKQPGDDASKEEKAAYYGEKADMALSLGECDAAKEAVDAIRPLVEAGAINRYAYIYECYLEKDAAAAKTYRRGIESRLARHAKRTYVIEQFDYADKEART